MNFKRLLHQPLGRFFISVLLGLGLASLFRKVCNDRNCIVFKGPSVDTIEGKVFKHGDKCFTYKAESSETCANEKRTVEISEQGGLKEEESKGIKPSQIPGVNIAGTA